MEINSSKDHPFRILAGAFAAVAFGAVLALAGMEHRSCSLDAAADCFSVAIIPLTLFCYCIWPDRITQSLLWIPWVCLFLISLLTFGAGIVCVVAHFGTCIAIISVSVSVFMGAAACIASAGRPKKPKP
jgi:hypothetical protein